MKPCSGERGSTTIPEAMHTCRIVAAVPWAVWPVRPLVHATPLTKTQKHKRPPQELGNSFGAKQLRTEPWEVPERDISDRGFG